MYTWRELFHDGVSRFKTITNNQICNFPIADDYKICKCLYIKAGVCSSTNGLSWRSVSEHTRHAVGQALVPWGGHDILVLWLHSYCIEYTVCLGLLVILILTLSNMCILDKIHKQIVYPDLVAELLAGEQVPGGCGTSSIPVASGRSLARKLG